LGTLQGRKSGNEGKVKMASVFISHSWHDKTLARKIAGTLARNGCRVWLDEAEIKIGDSLIGKIREGIDEVDFVIALISQKSSSSEWVSRELDIAMNQEIEGRRVKVLPILAEKCDPPLFLKGKLYVDMSTASSFRKSLPMLLDRVGARAETSKQTSVRKQVDDDAEQNWIPRLETGLTSGDSAKIYNSLKNTPLWKVEDLASHPRTLDRVFSLLDEIQPIHIRLQTLKLLEHLGDSNFAYRIEPLTLDTHSHIQASAIRCLAKLESRDSVPAVLHVLRSSMDPEMWYLA
jgi:hypothetical protein